MAIAFVFTKPKNNGTYEDRGAILLDPHASVGILAAPESESSNDENYEDHGPTWFDPADCGHSCCARLQP